MSTVYTLQLALPEDGSTTVINNIQVGNKSVYFRFQWAVASEEQYNLVLNYIDTKTKSDPLNDHGTYTYEYDYMAYYLALADKTEEESKMNEMKGYKRTWCEIDLRAVRQNLLNVKEKIGLPSSSVRISPCSSSRGSPFSSV